MAAYVSAETGSPSAAGLIEWRRTLLQVPINWRTIDLNLLVIFDAVSRERTVTRAAKKLGMTQTAISHALGRLRNTLQDELFIPTPDGMEPTPYARRLAEPIHEALQRLSTAFDKAGDFDPATTQRSFTVAVDHRAAVVMVASVSSNVAAVAPGIQLNFRPSNNLDLMDCLDRGEVDLAIGSRAVTAPRFAEQVLYQCKFLALMRRGHPAAEAGVLSAEALSRLAHIGFRGGDGVRG